MMDFLLIGHCVVDKIIDQNHSAIQPGGIFYSVVAFISQLETVDKLFLCTDVAEQYSTLFKPAFDYAEKKFTRTVDSIPQVELQINIEGERKETYSAIAANLNIPLKGLDRFNGILINMITGNDLSLTQLQELRKNYAGLIYFDVHTLSRGIDQSLNRNFRQINDFYEWAQCFDILQANESELKTLSSYTEEKIIVEELISYGIKQIIITRSEKGATVFYQENNYVKRLDKNALQLKTNNKVGCGDIFGSVYFYNYIKNKNISSALESANLFAGTATTYSNVNDLLNLKKDVYKRSGTK